METKVHMYEAEARVGGILRGGHYIVFHPSKRKRFSYHANGFFGVDIRSVKDLKILRRCKEGEEIAVYEL